MGAWPSERKGTLFIGCTMFSSFSSGPLKSQVPMNVFTHCYIRKLDCPHSKIALTCSILYHFCIHWTYVPLHVCICIWQDTSIVKHLSKSLWSSWWKRRVFIFPLNMCVSKEAARMYKRVFSRFPGQVGTLMITRNKTLDTFRGYPVFLWHFQCFNWVYFVNIRSYIELSDTIKMWSN